MGKQYNVKWPSDGHDGEMQQGATHGTAWERTEMVSDSSLPVVTLSPHLCNYL